MRREPASTGNILYAKLFLHEGKLIVPQWINRDARKNVASYGRLRTRRNSQRTARKSFPTNDLTIRSTTSAKRIECFKQTTKKKKTDEQTNKNKEEEEEEEKEIKIPRDSSYQRFYILSLRTF